ncbi:52 kDa repressor of the inhibitor of the protein kinase-like isoform X1 [Pocillopora verrucosa]|uniref:52 kDa repressor of the inhibitor of the protein kinase-like isoform X1 n=1 Tax=Pocillopora verrucosa TaxID=203993 RepID=UPI00333FF7CA
MTRGDPVCRREDCSPFDIGLVFDEIHNYSPHQKLEFVENVWKPVTATLEDISLNRNSPGDSTWNPTSRHDAQSLINAINFSFIVSLVIVRHILGLTRPLTVKLQQKAMDLLKAKDELALLKSVLEDMSTDIDNRHHNLYQEAVTIARQVAVQPEMPRIAQRQMHRNNAPAATPEGYFKINLTRVFLDHVLQQLNTRFQDDVFVCYKGISIIPSVLLATDPAWKANVLEFCNHYRQDIPNYAGLQAEIVEGEG